MIQKRKISRRWKHCWGNELNRQRMGDGGGKWFDVKLFGLGQHYYDTRSFSTVVVPLADRLKCNVEVLKSEHAVRFIL